MTALIVTVLFSTTSNVSMMILNQRFITKKIVQSYIKTQKYTSGAISIYGFLVVRTAYARVYHIHNAWIGKDLTILITRIEDWKELVKVTEIAFWT